MLYEIKKIANYMRCKDASIVVYDQELISFFLSNHDFPWLISFPRAGSHWLRMIMELYFKKPSLVRIFYYKDATDFTCYHRHDLELAVDGCRNVLYLYRNPVDTIYSQLSYHKEPLDDHERVKYWSNLYGLHLDKWLFSERFTRKKTILMYDRMRKNLADEFKKVTEHFGQSLSEARLRGAAARVTKAEVKRKAQHDQQVVQLQESYEVNRQEFRSRFGSLIWDMLITVRPNVAEYFDTDILPE